MGARLDPARSSILAVSAGVVFALLSVGAVAQEANGNGNGKENGEKDSESGWKYKAVVNRAFVAWDDGRRGTRFVDNDQDSTSFALEGDFPLANGWSLGVKTGFDFKLAGSDQVSQLAPANRLVTKIGEIMVEFGHDRWGKINFGHADSASDGTGSVVFPDSKVLSDAEVENWNSKYFLRSVGGGLTFMRWGDFFAGPQVGDTGRFVNYTFPKWGGLEFKIGVGQPQDIFITGKQPWFEEKKGGVLKDFGFKYKEEFNKTWRVWASLGAFKDTTEDKGAIERTEDTGLAGGMAVMHLPTGLNLAVNSGVIKHTGKCAERGEVSGECRGRDAYLFIKGGVVRNMVSWGPTSFYGEFYRGWRRQNESDGDTLRELELTTDTAEELRGSIMSVWGLGVVQSFSRNGRRSYDTDIYVGYRNYGLDNVSLLSADGPVGTKKLERMDAVMAGIRLRFGKVDTLKDE